MDDRTWVHRDPAARLGTARASFWISLRRKKSKKLFNSRDMLEKVLDAIPVRVFWKDLDSNYLGCNRPFATDSGLNSPKTWLVE